jgi:hypothetical protein
MSNDKAVLEELLSNFCSLCVRLNPQHKGCLACIEMNGYRDAVKAVLERIEVLEQGQEELARYREGASKLQDYIERLEVFVQAYTELQENGYDPFGRRKERLDAALAALAAQEKPG